MRRDSGPNGAVPPDPFPPILLKTMAISSVAIVALAALVSWVYSLFTGVGLYLVGVLGVLLVPTVFVGLVGGLGALAVMKLAKSLPTRFGPLYSGVGAFVFTLVVTYIPPLLLSGGDFPVWFPGAFCIVLAAVAAMTTSRYRKSHEFEGRPQSREI